MSKGEGEHWHCMNRDCDWSGILIISGEHQETLQCSCGGVPQKTESPPVFSYLDFLRIEELPEQGIPLRGK
jgi:hypothetical protein